VELIPLLLIAALHVVLPWALIPFATLALPRVALKQANPFAQAPPPPGDSAEPPKPQA
jgi:hypothetical protein